MAKKGIIMKKLNKFTTSPLTPSYLNEKQAQLDKFITGASWENPAEENISSAEIIDFPWVTLDDTEKTKGINLRMTKADLAKLQYISQNTPYSMQAFCYEKIKSAIEEKLKKI